MARINVHRKSVSTVYRICNMNLKSILLDVIICDNGHKSGRETPSSRALLCDEGGKTPAPRGVHRSSAMAC